MPLYHILFNPEQLVVHGHMMGAAGRSKEQVLGLEAHRKVRKGNWTFVAVPAAF